MKGGGRSRTVKPSDDERSNLLTNEHLASSCKVDTEAAPDQDEDRRSMLFVVPGLPFCATGRAGVVVVLGPLICAVVPYGEPRRWNRRSAR